MTITYHWTTAVGIGMRAMHRTGHARDDCGTALRANRPQLRFASEYPFIAQALLNILGSVQDPQDFNIVTEGPIKEQTLFERPTDPIDARTLQLRAFEAAEPSHLWLSGDESEGVVGGGQKLKADVETGTLD